MSIRTLLLNALSVSLCGGALTLLCLPLCRLLHKAGVPGRLVCLLWLAVGARFVIPGGIPVPVRRPADGIVLSAAGELAAAQLPRLAAVKRLAEAPPTASAEAVGRNSVVWPLLAAVWAAGTALLLLRAVFGCLRLRRTVALACKTQDGCYTCAAVAVPFTLGILHPRIYMPQSLQGPARRAILLHEQTHIRRGDSLTRPLYYLIACLHWWNPLAWLAFDRFEQSMEFACDEAAVGTAPAAERACYCESLLRFAACRCTPGTLAFGQGNVRRRIVHLLEYRRPAPAALGGCCIAVALACGVCLLRPQAEAAASAPPETPASTTAPAVQQLLPTREPDGQSGNPQNTAVAFGPPVAAFTYISRFMSAECGHEGTDYRGISGTPILAVYDGTVVTAGWNDSYGNYAVVDHGVLPGGHSSRTLYAHMDTLAVCAGDFVTKGKLLGTMGETGQANGVHLHLELEIDGVRTDTRRMIPYDNTSAENILLDAVPKFLFPLESQCSVSADYDFTGAAHGEPHGEPHYGTDFAADEGTPILAAADGVVAQVGYDSRLGYYVTVSHGSVGTDGYATRYSQMQAAPPVDTGQAVAQGQCIGAVGSTGSSTGNHLHFELLINGSPVDPMKAVSYKTD